jgi:two-component system sensor histidine kinase PilS (NtrC family)
MDEVIRNVLRLSRREPPRQERFALKNWVEDFADDFMHHEQLDPARLAIHIAPPEAEIVFDPSQLHQVVWNLCSNALRYAATDDRIPPIELQGGIGADSRFPYLDVIDHGPGIDPELVSQLFEPFFTTSERGTGLGLYIARQLCENNGGRLEYIPIPTGGSCFRIQFADPAKALEAA